MEPPAPRSGVPPSAAETPLATVPPPDPTAEPSGFVVLDDDGRRIHFLDWGGPDPYLGSALPARSGPTGVLLVHGIAQTAWLWSPVARRVRRDARVIAMDLLGHGLSDAPVDGYDGASLAADVVAVAEGGRLLEGGEITEGAPTVVLAGHGFGAIVAARAAATLGARCAGLVLVDGGWERAEEATGLGLDEYLRTVEEPPEVLRSMRAFLADREAFDPATWDADQERAARATVVETAAGRVVPTTRPHALTAVAETMFDYDPQGVLTGLDVPLVALVARDEEGRRLEALELVQRARRRAGREPIVALALGDLGHNLMRYRPDLVSGAILSLVRRADTGAAPARGGTIAEKP
jgi:pimeloyl-ACP methyl ester carboxylesterase